jgi:acyl carrier protein
MFKTYILPAVDKKVRELVLLRFQISPAERLYLKAGTISKTSSGKIKHQFNRDRFLTGHFDGLLARVSDAGEEEPEALTGIYGTVKSLFKSIVELDPEMDTPFLDQGGDSIKILEFIETLQEKYPVENEDLMDMIDEETSLNDVARWFEERL